MPPGTLPVAGRPRARAARTAMLAGLAALLAVAAAAEGVRVEPQIGPYRPRKVEFHPNERFLTSGC